MRPPKKLQKALQNIALQKEHTTMRMAEDKALLGVDYGARFCGLAFCPDGLCVFPLEVINTPELDQKVEALIEKKSIKIIILGLPNSPNQAENPLCKKIRQIAKKWQAKHRIPVVLQNETFSSRQTLSPEKSQRIDDLAAAKIIEFYLDAQNRT
jgi:putative transcription antitermination factor YqgF